MSEPVTSEPFVPPFQVRAIDRKDGLVVLAIRKGLIGTVANHLKVCPERPQGRQDGTETRARPLHCRERPLRRGHR